MSPLARGQRPHVGTRPVHMKKALSLKNIWEAIPASARYVIGGLLKPIPPAILLGRAFREHCAYAREAQWWPAERAREYQLSKLREVLGLAYERTAFYRQTFDRLGFRPSDLLTLTDLRRVPTIDRSDVVEHLSEMCAGNIKGIGVDFGSTGGMSGIPLHFYLSASRSSIEYAYLTTSWQRVGYRVGTPMAVLRGRVVRANRNGLYHEYDPLLRHHYYSSFHMSDDDMARYLEHISTIGPCFMHVYPSSVVALARFIRRRSAQAPPNVRGIIAESEIVYTEQRKMVEEVFGARLFSCYGHSEKLVLASGCEYTNDYHIWPTYGYCELLDVQGNPVTTPGEQGEIVGTGFINRIMPFIRYRTGDWATYVGERCEACGREHVVIRDIRGHRTQEVLVTADGSEISWTALNMHDDTFLHVRQFQFLQETVGHAVLRIVPAKGFSERDVSRIQRNLGRKFDGQLHFTIKCVDAIPLSPRGKAIYVDQRIRQGHCAIEDRLRQSYEHPD